MKCEICDRKFKNSRTLGIHISTTHKMSKQEYYDKFLKRDENEGKCLECGKETGFTTLVKGYRTFCSVKCLNQSQYHIKHCTETYTKNYIDNKENRKELNERTRNTCLEKYNGIGFASKELTEKYNETMLLKYGHTNPSQVKEIKEKTKQTNIEKYRAENVYASETIKEKIKETNLKRYNETSWTKSKEGREFLKNLTNSDKFKNKQYETKKINGTFKTSKIEKELESKLRELFPDLETQYKSELYPFNCDFYIPSLDLYIEYNGIWTHGGCFYDENNEENRNTLEMWKQCSEHSTFYQNAIETWTVRDLNKLNMALENSLNYVVWFNKEQAYDWIEKYKETIK
jgi:hypothetical protein